MVFLRKNLLFLGIILAGTSALGAQALRSMTFNGATGLYAIPSGYTSWKESVYNYGLDLGYHGIFNTTPNHLVNANLALFSWAEISFAYDFQYKYSTDYYSHNKNNDLILGTKVKIPSFRNTSIGIGGNIQFLNMGEKTFLSNVKGFNRYSGGYYVAGQIYTAITYKSSFFGSEAETSIMVGKTLYKDMEGGIDFGMGFDLIFLPQYMGRLFHIIMDFSNFSYSDSPNPKISGERGILNLGTRLDLSVIPPLSGFKVAVDTLITIGLNKGIKGSGFALGIVLGFPL
jgi:hypothetical protein